MFFSNKEIIAQLIREELNVAILNHYYKLFAMRNFLERYRLSSLIEYLNIWNIARISVTSTKSREVICSMFNEQTSIEVLLEDADRYAGDKLISCLEDSNRRVFRFWEVENNFSSVLVYIP